MSVPLTEPLQQALDERPGEPLRLVDPRTQVTYVLIRADLYERVQALVEEEDLTPEEKLFLLAESGRRAGWDAPEMDDYDNYDESRKKLCP
jgi:hypothetical protein